MTREIARLLESTDGQYRAEVVRFAPDGFLVAVFRRTEEWVNGVMFGESWSRVDVGISYVGDLERAEELAREGLSACQGAGH